MNLKRGMTSWFPLIIAVSERDGEQRLEVNSLVDFGQSEVEALAEVITSAYGELA